MSSFYHEAYKVEPRHGQAHQLQGFQGVMNHFGRWPGG